MRRLLPLAAILIALLAPAAAAGAGPELTRRALAAEMRYAGGASGALAVDLDTGEEIYASRADVARVPASVAKLYTTASALLRFGEEATLETAAVAAVPIDELGILTTDLYLVGGGDPTFDSGEIARLADALSTAGLAVVQGRVHGDESLFDTRRGGPESAWVTSPWVGPLSALSYNRGRTGLRRPYWQAEPARTAARALAAALRRRGVEVPQKVRVGRAPEEALELAAVASPAMRSLVRLANVPSDNFIAETLIKGLGAAYGGAGSTTAGARVVRSTMARLGVRPQVADGSGLSTANRTSPRQVVELLAAMAENGLYETFRTSLAIAGRTGTLSTRMRRSPARARCRAKTGTLRTVSALAGYCHTTGGSRVAFAFLMNGVYPAAARRLQDRMTTALATYSP